MVLNGESTHPNPWTPPTSYEQHRIFFHTPRIFHGRPKEPEAGPPVPSRWVDGSLGKRLAIATKDGLCIGGIIAVWDRYHIHRQATSSAAFARALYIIAPATAASISFSASRELFSRYVEDPYSPIPSGLSAAVSGSLIGAAYKSARLGLYTSAALGFFTIANIYLGRQGYNHFGPAGSPMEIAMENEHSYFVWREGDPLYDFVVSKANSLFRTKEDVPTWKKFEKE